MNHNRGTLIVRIYPHQPILGSSPCLQVLGALQGGLQKASAPATKATAAMKRVLNCILMVSADLLVGLLLINYVDWNRVKKDSLGRKARDKLTTRGRIRLEVDVGVLRCFFPLINMRGDATFYTFSPRTVFSVGKPAIVHQSNQISCPLLILHTGTATEGKLPWRT